MGLQVLHLFFLASVGVLAGVASGFFGIGGGIILVPALALLGGYSPKESVSLSLYALLFPVGIGAVSVYIKEGLLQWKDIDKASTIAAGLFLGAIIGAWLSQFVPNSLLKKLFALLLIYVAIQMWIKSND